MERKLVVKKIIEDEFCNSLFKSSYDDGDGSIFVFGLTKDNIATGAAFMIWEHHNILNLGIAMEPRLVSLFQFELHRIVESLTAILLDLNSTSQSTKVEFTPRLRNLLYGPPIAN
jgi:hypothetical protein